MTGFDIAVILLVGLGAITGFMRGFVQEVLALAAWVIALFMIHYAHTPVTRALEPWVGVGSSSMVLAFAVLLLVPYAIVKLLAKSFGEASRNSVLGPIDRVLGFGFGAMKGLVIVVVVFSIFVLGYDTVWGASGRPHWITQARTYPFVDASSRGLVELIAARRKAAASASAPVADEPAAPPTSKRKRRAAD
ncbi:CvpA family protein [Parablastomonas sp. CN1-191]|uniref:CvpA family protein n=1 Tax=Parablastomonas sp. CN1-191 TaxID=3400908 RepID=UPI003BF79001